MAVFFTVRKHFLTGFREKVNKACSNCRNDIKWNQDMIKECYHGH